jgi:hypothetical protein
MAFGIAAPARAADLTYHSGAGPHVVVFNPQAKPVESPYPPGEPAPFPWLAAPVTVSVNCLVSRPVRDAMDDFAGYRLYDVCYGSWVR